MSAAIALVLPVAVERDASALRTAELLRAALAWAEAFTSSGKGVAVLGAPAHHILPDGVRRVDRSAGVPADAQAAICFGTAESSVQEALAAADDVHCPKVYVWPVSKEDSIVDAMAEGTLALCKQRVFEGWLYPQSLASAHVVRHALDGSTLRVVPQVWTPSPLSRALGIAAAADAKYNAPARDLAGGIDVVIVSDLAGSTADVLTPLLICAGIHNAASVLRNIIVMRERPLPDATLTYIMSECPLADKVKYVAASRDEVVPFFMQRSHYSVFLYHQRDKTEFPSLLWDLCYVGVPVVHNLQTSMAAGLRYQDTDLASAGKLISAASSSLGQPYLERNRKHLQQLMPSAAAGMLRAFVSAVAAGPPSSTGPAEPATD